MRSFMMMWATQLANMIGATLVCGALLPAGDPFAYVALFAGLVILFRNSGPAAPPSNATK